MEAAELQEELESLEKETDASNGKSDEAQSNRHETAGDEKDDDDDESLVADPAIARAAAPVRRAAQAPSMTLVAAPVRRTAQSMTLTPTGDAPSSMAGSQRPTSNLRKSQNSQ